MYLTTNISPLASWLLLCCAVCVLLLGAIYFFRVWNVVKYRRRSESTTTVKENDSYLSASIIIYSQSEADTLANTLKAIFSQDYPADFEVIVVNDGESADIRDTVSFFRSTYPNLYLTFTPEGVVNLSRKKLALTLGIKAARYEVLVLTTNAVDIPSSLWLKSIMSPFEKGGKTEVALGFSYADPADDTYIGKRTRAFDYVADNVRWLSVAIAGKAFRGTEYNIAYLKDTFMRNKGFARTLNLYNGDDDIFVSEIARKGNTAVVLSEDSMVRLRHGNHPRIFSDHAIRRIFTERFIRRRPRFLAALTGWLQMAIIATATAASVVEFPNVVPAIASITAVIIMFALDIFTWRAAMKALKSRSLLFTLPWLSTTYPLRRFSRQIRSIIGKHKKYTWD
ncbi:MAG: glycosyltransferase [Muribaculaceae bacterium]|nr:glycosyltransferase [Muribaculaceae bacterium]